MSLTSKSKLNLVMGALSCSSCHPPFTGHLVACADASAWHVRVYDDMPQSIFSAPLDQVDVVPAECARLAWTEDSGADHHLWMGASSGDSILLLPCWSGYTVQLDPFTPTCEE